MRIMDSAIARTGAARRRGGFTLFEVALSLVLVSFSVVTVMLLIPSGLRSQQKARYALLASTKALEMIEFFSGKSGGERCADFEAVEPWEARPFCYTSTRWDLETRLARWDSGIMPVPRDIARRLESDGDEIRHLLDDGADIYYADPRAVPGIDPRLLSTDAPNEAQRLVFAVVGYAQNNAIPVFPWKAWPYLAAYPSPPLYVGFNNGQFLPAVLSRAASQPTWHGIEGWANGTPGPAAATARDPLMNDIVQKTADFYTNLRGSVPAPPGRETAVKTWRDPLLNAVFAYCEDKFNGRITDPLGAPPSGKSAAAEYLDYYLPPDGTDFKALGATYDADFNALCRMAEPVPGAPYDASKATMRAEIALRVQCMRFFAFAMGTFYQKRSTEAASDPLLSSITVKGFTMSEDRLRYYHDRCKLSAMRYAASFPYDWGAPRPVTRSIMMDYPLIEFDLFSPPRSANLVGTSPAVKAAMWRPVSAQTITSIGLPGIFPGALNGSAFDNTRSPFLPADTRAAGQTGLWGDASHFTLTRRFSPAERCRQLVFWAVDWQAYQDIETAPGAPLDASRCPMSGLTATNLGNYDSRLGNGAAGIEDCFYLRNPERELQFGQNVSGRATGAGVRDVMVGGPGSSYSDGGGNAKTVLLGVYGADRNHNFVLDRGPLNPAVRQRAVTVARFNFYDPRIPITLR
jgi:hypothetical protein